MQLKSDTPASTSLIEESVTALQAYIESKGYKGFDPYDGLQSPLFRLPFLRSDKTIRFYSQQFIKRFPINLRPLSGINPGLNPVTLGLCLQGYCNLITSFSLHKEKYIEETKKLINLLENTAAKGFHGFCWGYDFDWEARYARIPAYQPTIVATGIITNALYMAAHATGSTKAAEMVQSASAFVLNDLNIFTDDDKTICFSYSPFDRQKVFNASMKGVRLLAQAYSFNQDENLKTIASQAVKYVIKQQRSDGAWIYSTGRKGAWIDNYHTGYILDAMDEYIKKCNDDSALPSVQKGFSFYINNFIDQSRPKFYDKELYPIDCTAAAQCILTLKRFGHVKEAKQIAVWMINNMQDKKGFFYYRKHRYYTVKTSFMRWSQAWMFAALTSLIKEEQLR